MRALTLLCLLLCAAVVTGGNVSAPARRLTWGASLDGDEERLPGWHGEQSRGASAPHQHETKGDQYAREDRERGTWMELISWRPRAYVIHNFMSPEECVDLVKIARPFMARSTVVDSVTGESKVDPIRTRCVARRRTHRTRLRCRPPCARVSGRSAGPRGTPQHALLLTRWAPTVSRRSSLAGSTRWSPS